MGEFDNGEIMLNWLFIILLGGCFVWMWGKPGGQSGLFLALYLALIGAPALAFLFKLV